MRVFCVIVVFSLYSESERERRQRERGDGEKGFGKLGINDIFTEAGLLSFVIQRNGARNPGFFRVVRSVDI